MPTVLITPEILIDVNGPWVSMFEQAGFDLQYPADRTFTRGLSSEEQSIETLSGAARHKLVSFAVAEHGLRYATTLFGCGFRAIIGREAVVVRSLQPSNAPVGP